MYRKCIKKNPKETIVEKIYRKKTKEEIIEKMYRKCLGKNLKKQL